MNEQLMEIAFGLIANAGESKGLSFDALAKAKEGKFDEARALIEKSKEEMNKAHVFQTELITKEASGEGVEINVLLVHAQDHLMNAMNFQQLTEEFIELYERIEKLEINK